VLEQEKRSCFISGRAQPERHVKITDLSPAGYDLAGRCSRSRGSAAGEKPRRARVRPSPYPTQGKSHYEKPFIALAAAAALCGAIVPAHAADNNSALLDVLVRKGILTEKEAAGVQEEMIKEEKGQSASKIKLTNSISELRLYGDIRLRYQYDDKDTQLTNEQGGEANVSQRSRWRFRLRLNADFKLGENVFGGVELQTNQASDSANQSFENGFDDYNIYISRAYLGWNVTDWLTIVGGKMPNPFYTTELVWDSDINPTGPEREHRFPQALGFAGGSQHRRLLKEGKSVAPSAPEPSPWELTLNAGQFIFDDNNEFNGPDNDSSTDAYLFHTQIVSTYRFTKALSLTVAPGWMTYINGSVTGAASDGGLLNENDFSDIAGVSGATRNLNILLLPGDLSFKIGDIKTKLFWDVATTLKVRKRVEEIYDVVDRSTSVMIQMIARLTARRITSPTSSACSSARTRRLVIGQWRQAGARPASAQSIRTSTTPTSPVPS
jgi:hypothetical protein